MKKVLFIVHHRKDRSPGQRFRFEQYLNYLEANGFETTVSNILDADQDKIFYSKGNVLKKAQVVFQAGLHRIADAWKANEYDIIFIYREAYFLGYPFFEALFAKSRAKLIFDFDDSIWIDNVSDNNRAFGFLKNAAKTSTIIKMCDLVFAGNHYLAQYALQYNKNVAIVPTTIDTEEYFPNRKNESSKSITIGWSGSLTTIQHFKFAVPFLTEIKKKYGPSVNIKVMGDSNYKNEQLDVKEIPWTRDTEVATINTFDIGIMPLPNDPWTKGKCGFKGLATMSVGAATVMSPVGVNTEIIQDGVNGFLAESPAEWVEKLSRLIEDAELRKRLGEAGRQTVEDKYSVHAWRDTYLNHFRSLVK